MTERDKLILRLTNLKNSKSSTITLGIDYLLSVLGSSSAVSTTITKQAPSTSNKKMKIDVDGGSFNDDKVN